MYRVERLFSSNKKNPPSLSRSPILRCQPDRIDILIAGPSLFNVIHGFIEHSG